MDVNSQSKEESFPLEKKVEEEGILEAVASVLSVEHSNIYVDSEIKALKKTEKETLEDLPWKSDEIKNSNNIESDETPLISFNRELQKEDMTNSKLQKKEAMFDDPNDYASKKEVKGKVSVFEYLYGELRRGYILENDEQRFMERRERFHVFFKIPKEVEKFILYGFFQCIDAFLFLFTFLPLRFSLSLWFLVTRSLKLFFKTLFPSMHVSIVPCILQPAEICDLLKGIILISVSFMMSYVDTSMMYHIVKSQSVIKLYIMFSMLEVADKLISSFGQDILDALYWTATEPRGRKREHIGLIPHLLAGVTYVCIHSIIVLFQATTLNVAINSQNKALLTIMVSNNFVELKSMVFKKFEKNNLFQMSCSDVRERFHYMILLLVVIIQTMKEYSWSETHFWVLLPYCCAVLVAEMFVDWTKHAFITRFNEISYEVYKDYTVSLAYDLASCKLKHAFSDHSDLISRRMGFIPLPLGAIVIRVICGSMSIHGIAGILCLFMLYLCLISAKVFSSIVLLGKACDVIEVHQNSQKEKLPHPRQCNSLPSSRHHSSENIPHIVAETKSMPQSQSASISSSLADIAAQAEILQETMEPNPMFSNSSVSLNSFGMNDSMFIDEQLQLGKLESSKRWNDSSTFGGILRLPNEPLRRRVSLQEKVEFSDNLKPQ